MKRTLLVLSLVGACSDGKPAPVIPAPKVTVQDVKKDVEKAADTTAKLAVQTKDEVIAKADARLRQLDSKLDAVKADVATKKGEAKVAADKQLTELKKQRDQVAADLAELKKDAGTKWDEFGKKIDATADAFDAAFEDLKTRLQKL